MPSTSPSSNALSYRPYRLYWLSGTAASFAIQIIATAIGWQIYDITHNPLYLGLIGLVQFLPSLCFVLLTGLIADRFNRRWICVLCFCIETLCAFGLLAFTLGWFSDLGAVFCILTIFGIARAFLNPSSDALAPNLVPQAALPHAISLKSMTWQLSIAVGPMSGGLLYGLSGKLAYAVACGLLIASIVLLVLIGPIAQKKAEHGTTLATLFAGFKFIWRDPIVLGAVSLDLFAVLLGGAVALMPIYARDILTLGAWGLGLLRSAPGIGAVLMTLYLTRYPIKDHVGAILFLSVAGFGMTTLIFGFSTSGPISIIALLFMGAFDMVSAYVRQILVQLRTPNDVRGRVMAVNRLFIGTSNELGEFRAGILAAQIGAVAAVTAGGFGTLFVTYLWQYFFPQLRATRQLERDQFS